jgi:hypothetical protein
MTATELHPAPGAAAATAAPAATAVCVFAVRRDGAAPDWPAGTRGHAGGGPLGLLALPGTGLSAVVQEVPAADFGEEALRSRLADPAELEGCARAHHAVVTACAAAGPVVPLPLATLFTGPDRAAAALTGQRARFLAALDRVTGRQEWAVKVYAGPAGPPPAAAPGPAVPPATGPGAAYLARVRGRERDRQARQDAVLRVTEDVHRVAAGFAAAAVRRPPHGAAVTGEDRPQVLNAAFLVDEGKAAAMVAAVRALAGARAGLDVRVDVSGPWAPYSFTGDGHDGGTAP